MTAAFISIPSWQAATGRMPRWCNSGTWSGLTTSWTSATVAGSVEVEAGSVPAAAVLRFASRDGFGYRMTSARGAGRQFELEGLRPGKYRIEADSTQFYVKEIKAAADVLSPEEVDFSPGLNRLTVVAAADHGEVSGLVIDSRTGQPISHARVALHGNRGKYSVQADQAGHFLIGKVIPGDYRICAWTNVASDRLEDEGSWEQSGCQPALVPISPSSKTEIDIPATQ